MSRFCNRGGGLLHRRACATPAHDEHRVVMPNVLPRVRQGLRNLVHPGLVRNCAPQAERAIASAREIPTDFKAEATVGTQTAKLENKEGKLVITFTSSDSSIKVSGEVLSQVPVPAKRAGIFGLRSTPAHVATRKDNKEATYTPDTVPTEPNTNGHHTITKSGNDYTITLEKGATTCDIKLGDATFSLDARDLKHIKFTAKAETLEPLLPPSPGSGNSGSGQTV